MSRTVFVHTYDDIISLENLAEAWRDFARGKKSRKDVEMFGRNLGDNLMSLHRDLVSLRYAHGTYEAFRLNDPKPRDIHKASVRDRIVHRALYRKLYPFFDRIFIADSYSCRRWKGAHKALRRFEDFGRKVSRNNTRTAWVLKCDIRKFFASIDHRILFRILRKQISDKKILWLLYQVVGSFHSEEKNVGLPLGNLTSQLLVNIYMNEFDQFMKHELRAKYYIRYADDFVILSHSRVELEVALVRIERFMREVLLLKLHPDKVSIRTLASGIDFLGWVHFPHHRALRTATKRRMFRRLGENLSEEAISSYKGMLGYGDARMLVEEIDRLIELL